MTTFAVVDLETTGNQKSDRIIEIGVVIYRNQEIIRTYQTLINPNKHIPRFIEHLTGINNAMVMDQPTFTEVASEIHDLFNDCYFVAHNVPFDLGFLNQEFERIGLQPLDVPTLDTVELSRMILPEAPGFKLNQLAHFLSLGHDNPHRALSDASVTAEVLGYLLKQLQGLPKTTLKKLLPLAEKLKSDLAPLIKAWIHQYKEKGEDEGFDYHYGLAIKRVPPVVKETRETAVGSFGALLEGLEDKTTYRLRLGQKDMSEAIYHAFTSRTHTFIEAGTGLGKTLAYLLPAAYFARKTGEKVWISTYLKQLQKQLLHEEVPRLNHLLPFDVRVEVLKGKNQYISLKRFSEWIVKTDNDHYDFTLTKAIVLIWLTKTVTGDIDEIQLPKSGYQLFNQFSHRFDASENHAFSYYEHKRARVEQADLVVVNHALLHQMLVQQSTDIGHLIIDEGHHLPEVIEKEEGLMFLTEAIHPLLNQLIHRLKTFNYLTESVKETLEDIKYDYQLFTDYVSHLVQRETNRQTMKKVLILDTASQLFFDMQLMYERFKVLLKGLLLEVNETSHPLIRDDLTPLISDFLTPYDQFFNQVTDHEVHWVEIDFNHQQRPIAFYKKPVDISQCVDTYYLNASRALVLTSATLTVNHRFDYIKEQLGTSHAVQTYCFPAQYPTEDHVRILVPNDFPRIDQTDVLPYVEAISELVFSLAEITKGRMLILFNSYQMLKDTYHLLQELFQDDYVLIAQGISSGSHEKLKKHFQHTDQAILLGTHAFWEGLDIPGDDLKCVIIARLPFQSPSQPVVKAKLKRLESQGQSGFYAYSLPDAVLRFKQGFGRLIRSASDTGIVVVTDDRLVTKEYGRIFIQSLPELPIYHRRTAEIIDIAQQFLQTESTEP